MQATGAPRPLKRVLLLEDCEDDAKLFAIELELADIHVDMKRVANEAELLDALAVFHPHLVVSDSNLPGFSGFEALALVRELAPEVPFVFLTGNGDDHPDARAARQSAAGYLNKDRLHCAPALVSTLLAR